MKNIGDIDLTPDERIALKIALTLGNLEGPAPTDENIDFFRVPFAAAHLRKIIEKKALSNRGLELAKSALAKLEAAS